MTDAIQAAAWRIVTLADGGAEGTVALKDAAEIANAYLGMLGQSGIVDVASDIDKARREGWAQGMIDTLKSIQSVGKVSDPVMGEALRLLGASSTAFSRSFTSAPLPPASTAFPCPFCGNAKMEDENRRLCAALMDLTAFVDGMSFTPASEAERAERLTAKAHAAITKAAP